MMNIRYGGFLLIHCMALLSRAPADIVWSGEQNLGGYEHEIDLNADSLSDVYLSYDMYGDNSSGSESAYGFIAVQVDGPDMDGSNRLLINPPADLNAPLSYGTLISGNPMPPLEWGGEGRYVAGIISNWSTYPEDLDTEWNGPLGDNGNTYIGIAFGVGESTHYGWVNIALGEEGPFGFDMPVITSWAYESTPDTPILAGAIPEPSSGILAFIGAFALLIRARARCHS